MHELILKATGCKGKNDYLMKVEERIHYSDGNVRFANVDNPIHPGQPKCLYPRLNIELLEESLKLHK